MIFPIDYLAPWKYIYISSGTLPIFPLEIWYINHPLVLCQYDHGAKWARPMAIWGCIPGKTPAMSQNQFQYPVSVPHFFHWFNGCLFPLNLVINIIPSGKRLHNYGKSPCY